MSHDDHEEHAVVPARSEEPLTMLELLCLIAIGAAGGVAGGIIVGLVIIVRG